MSGDTRSDATQHDHVAATWKLVRGAHGMRAMWCGKLPLNACVHVTYGT